MVFQYWFTLKRLFPENKTGPSPTLAITWLCFELVSKATFTLGTPPPWRLAKVVSDLGLVKA